MLASIDHGAFVVAATGMLLFFAYSSKSLRPSKRSQNSGIRQGASTLKCKQIVYILIHVIIFVNKNKMLSVTTFISGLRA